MVNLSVRGWPVSGPIGVAQIVYPGEEIAADVVWRNNGSVALAPRFRLDLKPSSWPASWVEGPWVTSPTAYPGGTATAQPYRQVPGDWGPGTLIDVKIMVEGIEGAVWEQNDIFEVGVAVPVEILSVTPYVSR